MKYKDISGQKFGRLIALYKLHNYHKTGSYWLCYCECGNVTEVYLSNLSRGATMSCGCLNKELTSKRSKKHGMKNTRLYYIWSHIKARCYNKNHDNYKYYGGRGIIVCDNWKNDFIAFYNWAIANGYQDNLTIDRIDVNGNYEPNNCRWASWKQQQRNTRHNRNITSNGETHCLIEWCEILGVNRSTVYSRLRRGSTIYKALGIGD